MITNESITKTSLLFQGLFASVLTFCLFQSTSAIGCAQCASESFSAPVERNADSGNVVNEADNPGDGEEGFDPEAMGLVNYSPQEQGGTAKLVQGRIVQGNVWDAFNEDGNAFTRCRNYEGEYIYQVERESAVFERRWEQPLEVKAVEIVRRVNELESFKFLYYDLDEEEWQTIIHETDHEGGDYQRVLEKPIRAERVRFELITTDSDGLRLREVRFFASPIEND